MGAYENYTGAQFDPSGLLKLGSAIENTGAIIGSAIEKRAALDKLEEERKRKEREAEAKKRRDFNAKIQSAAFRYTYNAQKNLNDRIEAADLDMEFDTSAIKELTDEFGDLAANLEFNTNMSPQEKFEKTKRFGELNTLLNQGLNDTLTNMNEVGEQYDQAIGIGIGSEGGLDIDEDNKSFVAKHVFNGSIPGKRKLVPGKNGAMNVEISGVEGMEPFIISADSLSSDNFNTVPKLSNEVDTAMDEAHINTSIEDTQDANTMRSILRDAGGSTPEIEVYYDQEGNKMARLTKDYLRKVALATIDAKATKGLSDPINAEIYQKNILSRGGIFGENVKYGKDIELSETGKMSEKDEEVFRKNFIDYQLDRIYETSNVGKPIMLKSFREMQDEKDRQNIEQDVENQIDIVANRADRLLNLIYRPNGVAAEQKEQFEQSIIGETIGGSEVQSAYYDPETNKLSIVTGQTTRGLKPEIEARLKEGKSFTVNGTMYKSVSDVPAELQGELYEDTVEEKDRFTIDLNVDSEDYFRILQQAVFTGTSKAEKELLPYVDAYMKKLFGQEKQNQFRKDLQNRVLKTKYNVGVELFDEDIVVPYNFNNTTTQFQDFDTEGFVEKIF